MGAFSPHVQLRLQIKIINYILRVAFTVRVVLLLAFLYSYARDDDGSIPRFSEKNMRKNIHSCE